MWRAVTRGLVLSFVILLLVPAVFAQVDFVGSLDSPDPSQTQSGVVLVKGWALNPQAITKIELYVDDQFQFITNTGQPRIDIVEAYPNYPGIHNIAPGFQVGFLASRFTNGPHTVYVKVYTSDNKIFQLPTIGRTINIDNTVNQSPFGSVDQPDLAAIYNASGSFPVVGWAADTDGIARVDVAIDDGILQSVIYGDARPDVGNAFPDFPGALFSGFIANVDTTRIQDGVHLLTVRATDRLGLSRNIGTRQIQILNSNTNLKPFGYIDEPRRDAVLFGTLCGQVPVLSPAQNPQAHITPVRGWALDLGTRTDVGRVSYVELMIDGVRWYSSDDCAFNPIFGQYANCYGLPRYDVERYYPNYPDAPRSGFMFTMDVGALMALGVRPGNHVLSVRVGDQQQTFTELPNRDGIPVFFTCTDQNHDFASSGYIDIPTSFDYVKGVVTFQGWAADDNGGVTAVEMVIDGNFVGSAQYGFPRPDVVEQNPQLRFAANSGWRFQMDTSKLANSRHRLTVRVVDTFGNRSEIGSVDFYTQNPNLTP